MLPLDEVLQSNVVIVGAFDVCFVFRVADTSVSACCFAAIIIVLNDLGAQSRCLFKDHVVDGLKECDRTCRRDQDLVVHGE